MSKEQDLPESQTTEIAVEEAAENTQLPVEEQPPIETAPAETTPEAAAEPEELGQGGARAGGNGKYQAQNAKRSGKCA